MKQNTYQLLNSSAIEAIWDHSLIGLAIVSQDGNILAANPKFQEITGYSDAELKELTFQEITHPEDIKKDVFLASQVVRGERRKYRFEKRYIKKEGGIVFVLLKVVGIRDNQDDFNFFVSQVMERKRPYMPDKFLKGLALIVFFSQLLAIIVFYVAKEILL